MLVGERRQRQYGSTLKLKEGAFNDCSCKCIAFIINAVLPDKNRSYESGLNRNVTISDDSPIDDSDLDEDYVSETSDCPTTESECKFPVTAVQCGHFQSLP